jgi:hypothetical protein
LKRNEIMSRIQNGSLRYGYDIVFTILMQWCFQCETESSKHFSPIINLQVAFFSLLFPNCTVNCDCIIVQGLTISRHSQVSSYQVVNTHIMHFVYDCIWLEQEAQVSHRYRVLIIMTRFQNLSMFAWLALIIYANTGKEDWKWVILMRSLNHQSPMD